MINARLRLFGRSNTTLYAANSFKNAMKLAYFSSQSVMLNSSITDNRKSKLIEDIGSLQNKSIKPRKQKEVTPKKEANDMKQDKKSTKKEGVVSPLLPPASNLPPFYPHYRNEHGELVPYTRKQYIQELQAKGKNIELPSNVKFKDEEIKESRKDRSNGYSKSSSSKRPVDDAQSNKPDGRTSTLIEMSGVYDSNSEFENDDNDDIEEKFTSNFVEDVNDVYDDEDEEEDPEEEKKRQSLLELLIAEEKSGVRSVATSTMNSEVSGTLRKSIKSLTPLSSSAAIQLQYQQSVDRLQLKGLRYDHRIKMWIEPSTGLTMTNQDINTAYYEAVQLKKQIEGIESPLGEMLSSNNKQVTEPRTNILGKVLPGPKPPNMSAEEYYYKKRAERPRNEDGVKISHTEARQIQHRQRFEQLPPRNKAFPQRVKTFLVSSVLEQKYDDFVKSLNYLVQKYVIGLKAPLHEKTEVLMGLIDQQLLDNLTDDAIVQLVYCLGQLNYYKMWLKKKESKQDPTSSNSINIDNNVEVKANKVENISSSLPSSDVAKVNYNVSLSFTNKSNLTISDQPKMSPEQVVDELTSRILRLRVNLSYEEGVKLLEGIMALGIMKRKNLQRDSEERRDLIESVFLSMTNTDGLLVDTFLSIVRLLSVLKIDFNEIPKSTQTDIMKCLEDNSLNLTPTEASLLLNQLKLISCDIKNYYAPRIMSFPVIMLCKLLDSENELNAVQRQQALYLLDGIHSVGLKFKMLEPEHKDAVIYTIEMIVKGKSTFQIYRVLQACLKLKVHAKNIPVEVLDELSAINNENIRSVLNRLYTIVQ